MAATAELGLRPQKKFVTIGHITEDVIPNRHLGGGVSYSGVVAKESGYHTSILTKCRPEDPYVTYLREKRGIEVYVAPSNLNTITTFENIYDDRGNREQKVTDRQEILSSADLDTIPTDLLEGAIVLAAPVIGEVDMRMFPILAAKGATVAVTPQGYFREAGDDGKVKQKRWTGFEEYLPHANGGVVFSIEDIKIGGKVDEGLKNEILATAPLAAMTLAEKGVVIYEQSKDPVHIPAFPLHKREEIDYTGAGDTFTARWLIEMAITNGDTKKSGATATLFTALKIAALAGDGIDSIPPKEKVENFVRMNRERVNRHYENNGVENPFK